MSGASIFPVCSLDRRAVHWEDHLRAPTPWTRERGHWWKRDDFFAPLGYGGVNGSKLRQLIHLAQDAREAQGILTGCSVLSPQGSMCALVGAHYGLPVHIVLGATKWPGALKHENVAIANAVGANFTIIKVGYNPAIQKAVSDLHETRDYRGWWRLPYAIGTERDAPLAQVAQFHAYGAAQVQGFPAGVHTLVMTIGSAYSAASVLFGLALWPPPDLRRIVLIGVGPTRLEWLDQRLEQLEKAEGTPIRALFRRNYADHPDLALIHNLRSHSRETRWLLDHYDLHSTKWCSYQDRMPFRLGEIALHPTYEGKALRYMAEQPERFSFWHEADEQTAFWIVGSEPSLAAMAAALPEMAHV